MTYQTPCQRSDTPEDWFLERDGKQYPDDEWVTEEERAKITDTIQSGNWIDEEGTIKWHLDRLERLRKEAALRRRRHALEACQNECYFRTQCLEIGIEENPPYGIFGGYDREQRKQIVDLREEKRREREARSSVPAGE